MARLALAAAVLILALAPGARAADEGDGGPTEKPLERPQLTATELDARLDKVKLTVDWRDFAVLDAINEVQQKSGLKFDYDQATANFAAGRKVSFDGYSVTVREALRVLGKAGGFAVEPDAERQLFRLKMDATYPTRVAMEEKKLSVKWSGTPVSTAIKEIEKKTGLKVELHETMKKRLSSRKITWEADAVTAREAIETLYVYPPPSVPGRLEARKDMTVLVIYNGIPETKGDVELFLDERKMQCDFPDTSLEDVARFLWDVTKLTVEMDKKLRGRKLAFKAEQPTPLRAVLDGLARAGKITWKIEGPKVVFRDASGPSK
jgi:hypothetical protein